MDIKRPFEIIIVAKFYGKYGHFHHRFTHIFATCQDSPLPHQPSSSPAVPRQTHLLFPSSRSDPSQIKSLWNRSFHSSLFGFEMRAQPSPFNSSSAKVWLTLCFRKRNLAMRTWRSKALQWEKKIFWVKCGLNADPFQSFCGLISRYSHQNSTRSLKRAYLRHNT